MSNSPFWRRKGEFLFFDFDERHKEETMNVKPEEQLRMIMKGTHLVVDETELLIKLQKSFDTQTPLVIKLGLDPTAPDIHLGHCVVLRKIKQFQDFGHKVVIVIGDFTGKIGDPTGRAKGRVALTDAQVIENAKTYCEQIFKVLDQEKTEVLFNSEWLSKLNFEEVIRLASTTTVARILERDDFQNRYKQQVPIGIHEFFYPLMQAYDSIHLKADVEIGGTDQTFNILMGRNLQKSWGEPQQVAIFMPILEGLDGVEKMSKSLGNYIGIDEAPEVMFKKVMEIPDDLIIRFFNLTTDEHPDDIEIWDTQLKKGCNPRNVKLELAKILTGLYHGDAGQKRAEAYFETAFTKKAIPSNVPELSLATEAQTLNDLIPQILEKGFIESRSAFVRLLKQEGVQCNGEKLSLKALDEPICRGDVLKIGKKTFIRFV